MRCMVVIFMLASCAMAAFDDLRLPDYPVHYNDYSRQCHVPVKCSSDPRCPNINDWKDLERWAQQEAFTKFKRDSSFEDNPSSLISDSEYDFNLFFTKGLDDDQEIGVKNTLTTDILLQYLAIKGKCSVRNMLERHCPNVSQSLSLEKCQHRKLHKCDPDYPYRSYDGVCNNLRHATWGQAGNPLKFELAPCFDDYVSKRRMSASGRSLPNNREVISDIQRVTFDVPTNVQLRHVFTLFGVLFSELVNTDIIGRAMKRARNATTGFRGCRPDGSGVSLYRAPLTAPMDVSAQDPNYGPMHVECLNFSPIENANDQCDIRYPTKRNIGTSYLDLDVMYAHGNYDSEGKIVVSHCKASSAFDTNHVLSIQFLSVAGLFSQLHNYCIDRASSCCVNQSKEIMIEKCRALTIGVYQRIVYEELLLSLFGEEFYKQCNFDCEYDEDLESSVSSTYTNSAGRFQHIWIPDNVTVVSGNDRVQRPFFEFFLNLESFDCPSILEGMLEDPVQSSRMSDSLINTFFSKDGKKGHCLMCLDLERGRDAGLCPLVLYKHYFDKISGNPTKCYESFDDLNDIFQKELVDVFRNHYESPHDIDALFLIFEKVRDKEVNMPRTIATAYCVLYKRLKCSDRFFYSWNQFLSPAQKELIHSIDMSTLLALFGGIKNVPVVPWHYQSKRVPAQQLLEKIENKLHLFCSL
ncbi:heme peroxidase 2-like [Ochlerotatus camptorhynchus]|uniref:heme peroxidase 2-like n=1 Tax=Ochlerotatus camptorhynchus TaxID=644619 RepID=UPI0031E3DDEA